MAAAAAAGVFLRAGNGPLSAARALRLPPKIARLPSSYSHLRPRRLNDADACMLNRAEFEPRGVGDRTNTHRRAKDGCSAR